MQTLIAVAFLIGGVQSVNEVSTYQSTSLKAMERAFARSETTHQASMSAMMRSMSVAKAVVTLEKSHLNKTALAQITTMVLNKGHSHLRKQPKGYSGIEGARKLLNDMIYESMSKYDGEIAKCTDYYSKQCAAMEVCRGQISASNYIAANSRGLILDSQATINQMEVDIPTGKMELKQHNLKCEHELKKMKDRLVIVLGDIAIMTTILEMTDCKKSFVQQKMTIRKCTNECTKKSFIEFNHDGLQARINKLQSGAAKDLMGNTFSDLFDGVESLEGASFLQTGQAPSNKTKFANPPTPRTPVPGNPCTDPDMGAPSAADKRAAKCTIKASPQCYKLQERFLLIQSGIQDERDQLLTDIADMEHNCEETKNTLETQISNDEKMLDNAQTKLAGATEKEATAGETARQTATENDQYNKDLTKQMGTCQGNYVNFESEICALKKIRGELYKMKGSGHSAFFQDCEVSKWDPEECTKVCAGGNQQLTRSVLTHPNGGAKCLPLSAETSCNNHPCPVDCKLHAWSGWSKCSAECGGGVQQRLREVDQAMKYGGKPCGSTSETRSCNGQACEKDCTLTKWTAWSPCSKDCDGGTRKREKYVQSAPEGAGECPDKWSTKRLEYKNCNQFMCLTPQAGDCSSYEMDEKLYTCANHPPCCQGSSAMGTTDSTVQCLPNEWGIDESYKVKCAAVVEPKACNSSLDIVLLLDGSGSLGKKGWKATVKAAEMFTDSFKVSANADGDSKANVAVILFSGPPTWSGVKKCVTVQKKKVDPEKFCRIKMVSHFTKNMKKLKQKITGLEWPKGSTLTSLALMTAKTELTLGRKDSKAVVIVITDGRPLSMRKTKMASRALRKSARLVWVAVTKFAPLKQIKKWATNRWQENVIQVDDFLKLESPDVITHIMADICPSGKNPDDMEFEMPSMDGGLMLTQKQ